MLRTIGPVWDGNEVWLLAGGGTLYFAFPLLYASAFSGFYLALMIVLWLLILRGARRRTAHAYRKPRLASIFRRSVFHLKRFCWQFFMARPWPT